MSAKSNDFRVGFRIGGGGGGVVYRHFDVF